MLSLAEVEQWHYCRLFVLGWVAFKDFGHELLVDGIEGEWD